MSSEQLKSEMLLLTQALNAETHEVGQFLLKDTSLTIRLDEPPSIEPEGERLFSTRVDLAGQEISCVYLPENEFPHLCAKRREIRWLNRDRFRRAEQERMQLSSDDR